MSSYTPGVNDYTNMTTALASELLANLPQYSDLVVHHRVFRPQHMPPMDTYAIIISPPTGNLWKEYRETLESIAYLLTADLFLLVRNYDETLSLHGTTAPNLGIFQFISDVKDYLRFTNLGGMLQKTYDEPAGQGSAGVSFELGAVNAFESGQHIFVHKAKIPYTARVKAFCYPRNFT